MFLLLGAIVNVAVAWGCVMIGWNSVVEWIYFDDSRLDEAARRLGHSDGFGLTHVAAVLEMDTCTGATQMRLIYGSEPFCVDRGVLAGLPLISLVGTQRQQNYITVAHGGILQPAFLDPGYNCLPVVPLWPGFAINTIFYAAILWLLWIAPGRIRRIVRVRGHRCPACGFIIAPNTCANGLCSECGAKLPKGFLDKPRCEV